MQVTRWGYSRWGTFRWFVPGARTAAQYRNLPAWQRDVGGVYEGDGSDGNAPGVVALPDGDLTLAPVRAPLYTLEVYHPTLDVTVEITRFWGDELDERIDEAAVFKFTVEYSSANRVYFAPPYRIVLRDRWGMWLNQFEVRQATRRRAGDGLYLDVVAVSMLAQLAREPLLEYSTHGAEISVGEILAELLTGQVATSPISLYQVDAPIADYTVAFAASRTTVLGAIRSLQALLPLDAQGHFYVDAYLRFSWTVWEWQWGNRLEIGEGLAAVEYSENWDDLVTRLYAYGNGGDEDSQVSLLDAGEAAEYIEAATVGTYGVVPRVIVDNRIKHAASLLVYAQRYLEQRQEPYVEVKVGAIDLAKADGERFTGFDDLYAGREYQVVDASLELDTRISALRKVTSLARPLGTRMELANRDRGLVDVLEAVVSQLSPEIVLDDDHERNPIAARIFPYDVDPGAVGWEDLVLRDGDLRFVPAAEAVDGNAAMQMWVQTDPEDATAGGTWETISGQARWAYYAGE